MYEGFEDVCKAEKGCLGLVLRNLMVEEQGERFVNMIEFCSLSFMEERRRV